MKETGESLAAGGEERKISGGPCRPQRIEERGGRIVAMTECDGRRDWIFCRLIIARVQSHKVLLARCEVHGHWRMRLGADARQRRMPRAGQNAV